MTFSKDPNATLDYAIDWSRWLASGDEITDSAWTVPAPLASSSSSASSTRTVVWLSGGAVGESYTVTNRITTTGGRIDDRSFVVKINER